ncbi:MAG TPA: RING finger protein [Candidatus Methanoperedens sp.]
MFFIDKRVLAASFIFFFAAQASAALEIEPFFCEQAANESIKSVSISHDGEFVAVTSEDNFIHFFNKSGKKIWNMEITGGKVSEAATNGRFIAAGINYLNPVERSEVRLYSGSGALVFEKDIQPLNGSSSNFVQNVAISGDGNTILASTKKEVHIFDRAGNLIGEVQINGSITDASISQNKGFGAVSADDSIIFFSFNGRIFQRFEIENNSVERISVSDEGYIAMLSPQTISLYLNSRKLWDKNAKSGNFFKSISISPAGDFIAVSSSRDGLVMFDRNGLEVLRYKEEINHVSTDGRSVAGAKNSFLCLFNIISSTTASVSLLSTQGAKVFMDGKFKGEVPLMISGIPAGTHKIEIIKKGYETWVQNVNVSYGETKEISIMLAPSIVPADQDPIYSQDVFIIPKNILYLILFGIIFAAVLVHIKKTRKLIIPPSAFLKVDDMNYDLFIGRNCPYCGDIIKANSRIVVCTDCRTPHHQECWEKHEGCTTFGCGRTSY